VSDIPTLDRVDWHAGSRNFPKELAARNAGTHIGMFLAWCVMRDMLAADLKESLTKPITVLCNRGMTGREFLVKHCDGMLDVDLFTQEAGAFAASYYSGKYTKDYKRTLALDLPSEYHVADTWANYERIEPVISEAYQKWKNPPWWKIF
jgi:hypothetical protein